MDKIYIITGANGHLASTIIKYLRHSDCKIRGLVRSVTDPGDSQLSFYPGDVTQPQSMEAIFSDTGESEVIVIHTAGIISISEAVTPQLYEVNVTGTKNVIDKCREHKVKRLVYVSSVHAIPEGGENCTIEETDHFSKDSVLGAYAKTKAEATQAVLDAEKDGLDAVVVHPSGILGPYDPGRNHIVQLIGMYLKGTLPAGVTGGYDFVDVRDVAKGCIAAAEQGRTGQCYILSNRFFSVMEILDCARAVIGGRKKICLPVGLAKAFVPVFELGAKLSKTRPLFTKYALSTISGKGHFSHDKAAFELGYHPRDMRRTVADTVAWLRGQSVSLDDSGDKPDQPKS